MPTEIKQEEDLTEQDFKTHPVWRIARHVKPPTAPNAELNERSFATWSKPIEKDAIWPHSKLLVSGSFQLADGTPYSGFFQLVGTNWDDPLPPRQIGHGNFAEPLRWSARRAGAALSILSLISPRIFVGGNQLDFNLHKMLQVRETHIRAFYMQIEKTPGDVFPVRFATDFGIDSTVNSGVIPGFYRFPLDKPHELSNGQDVWSRYWKA